MNRREMKFIWRIQNFIYLQDGMLQSPSFSAFSNTWEVIIYPMGKYNDSNISIELNPLENKSFDLCCSFAFLTAEGLPLISEKRPIHSTRRGKKEGGIIPNFLKSDDIFGSRTTKFLSNNNMLIVECCIWNKFIPLIDGPSLIYARSRIEPLTKVIQKTFDCSILEISSHNVFHNVFEHEELIIGSDEFLNVKVALKGSNINSHYEVTFNVSMFRSRMKVQICLRDAAKMEWTQCANDEFLFKKKGDEWTVNTNVTRSMILSNPSLYLPNGALSFRFICTFSENVTFNRLVDENEIPINNSSPIAGCNQISESNESADEVEGKQLKKSEQCVSIGQALQGVYEEGFLSDFNLRVGDKVFPVHRVILGARSSVFRAMFTTEMKEKEDNFVDIPDVDEDTLQRMLKFVYCDQLDASMGWEAASSLYAAADKYALEPLKGGCVSILKSELCVSSVLHVLSLADLHQDEELKSAAYDFILSNDKEIVGTECWVRFEEENGQLALETCRKLYLMKLNG